MKHLSLSTHSQMETISVFVQTLTITSLPNNRWKKHGKIRRNGRHAVSWQCQEWENLVLTTRCYGIFIWLIEYLNIADMYGMSHQSTRHVRKWNEPDPSLDWIPFRKNSISITDHICSLTQFRTVVTERALIELRSYSWILTFHTSTTLYGSCDSRWVFV